MKKLLCNTLIIIIMMGVCCNVYFGFSGLSFSDRVSYAEADNWTSCDSSDLVTAFRYYCKSRNLAIEGSVADALTSFTTTTFNNICSTLGIDPTQLQAELKKTTSGNLGLRFLFSNTGITAYNRIFAEFLQNNNLSVGDEVEDKVLETSKYFTSLDGYSCRVFVVNDITAGNDRVQVGKPNHPYDVKGTPFYYSYDYIYSLGQSVSSSTIRLNENVSTVISISYETGDNIYKRLSISNNSNNLAIYSNYRGTLRYCGYPCIILGGNNKLYLGGFAQRNGDYNYESIKSLIEITDGTATDEDVYITTNNTTINNNSYNNNYVIIYNEGDTYVSDDDDEPLPNTPPGGGDDPIDPDPDDPLEPYDPTKPFPDTPDNPTPDPGVHGSPGSDGTITLPDFNFDIPDLNWSLDGLQHKFPFSLPFDLYNACKLLNAEPQTPELDYTVDLVVYQWPIQMDLHWLDPAARVIRIFELLAFIVGLILITRHLIGG